MSDEAPDDAVPTPPSDDSEPSEGLDGPASGASEETTPPHVVIITGLSGSGKSTAINALEDAGFFCIDNLPVPLLPKVLELASSGGGPVGSLAFVIDTRERMFLDQATEMVDQLRAERVDLQLLFLEADEEELVRRYSETRRRHPMTGDDGTVREGIRRERETLAELRKAADILLDTSEHTVHTLKKLIQRRYAGETASQFTITVLSFGFKHGLPTECDLVFDLRFLSNPYFVEELREKDGRDEAVEEYVLAQPQAGKFISHFQEMAEFMLPEYEQEGKSYLTIGIGCTGGHHRSVALAEAIATRLRGRNWDVQVRHRDVEK